MKNNKKIVDLLYFVSLQLFIVFVLFLFLDSFNIFDVSSYLYLELLFLVSLICFGVSFALKYEGNLVLKKYLPYLFLLSLLIFVVHEFYPLGFVDSWKYYLMSLSVFLGALSFWFNREVIDVVEEESNEEKLEEDKREKEFGKKFPFFERFNISYRITSSSGLWKILFVLLSPLIFIYRLPYSFIKWCYKEGWWYSGGLVLIVLVVFFIFFDNSDIGLQGDEIFQGQAIKSILNYGFPLFESGIVYTRGIFLSYVSSVFGFFFGLSEWVVRIPNLIFYLIFIFFIIFTSILTKTNKLLLLYILTLNPWTINMIKFSRIYIPLSVLIFIIIYFSYKYLFTKNNYYFYLSIFLFFLGFLFHKGIFILAVVISIIILVYLINNKKSILKISVIGFIGFISIISIYILDQNSRLFNLIRNLNFSELLNTGKLFFIEYFITGMSIFGIFIIIGFLIVRKNRKFDVIILLSIASFFILLTFLNIKTQPRYFYPVFFLIVIYSSIIINYYFIFLAKNKKITLLLIIIPLLIVGLNHTKSLEYNVEFDKYNAISFAIPTLYNDKNFILEKNDTVISLGSNDLVHQYYYTNYIDYYLTNKNNPIQRTNLEIINFEDLENISKKTDQEIFFIISYGVFETKNDLLFNKGFSTYTPKTRKLILESSYVLKENNNTQLRKLNKTFFD